MRIMVLKYGRITLTLVLGKGKWMEVANFDISGVESLGSGTR